jgi:hypothetical protein
MHQRQRIRDAVAQQLRTAAIVPAANVFTSRARPVLEILQRREAVLSVYTGDETSQRTPDAQLIERTLTVSIEGMAGGGDDLDDTLDTMAEAVEAALEADPTLGGLLSAEMELTATTSEITARGNQQVGAFRMDFDAKYQTVRTLPVLDDLWPEQPLPTQVFITPVPTPAAYVPPLGGITPPTIERDVVAPSQQPEPLPNVCADGVCVPGAWQGDPA